MTKTSLYEVYIKSHGANNSLTFKFVGMPTIEELKHAVDQQIAIGESQLYDDELLVRMDVRSAIHNDTTIRSMLDHLTDQLAIGDATFVKIAGVSLGYVRITQSECFITGGVAA